MRERAASGAAAGARARRPGGRENAGDAANLPAAGAGRGAAGDDDVAEAGPCPDRRADMLPSVMGWLGRTEHA